MVGVSGQESTHRNAFTQTEQHSTLTKNKCGQYSDIPTGILAHDLSVIYYFIRKWV